MIPTPPFLRNEIHKESWDQILKRGANLCQSTFPMCQGQKDVGIAGYRKGFGLWYMPRHTMTGPPALASDSIRAISARRLCQSSQIPKMG